MSKLLKLTGLAVLAGMVLSLAGCAQLEARNQLNLGVASFKAAQFNQAIEHFDRAIQLDPTLINAKLYLATAYQSQFIPGAPSVDNMNMATQALNEYKTVLDQDANNANAIAGIARLNYDMGNLDEARTYYQKAIQVEPNDPTAYYTLGAIAYQQTIKGQQLLRTSEGITDLNAPLISKKSPKPAKQQCDSLAQQDGATIDDGISQLQKALQLSPEYADAMTYLNLLYREKGDLTCGNDAARAPLIKTADDFSSQALAARKAAVAKANAKNSGGVVINPDGGSGN